MDNKVYCKAGRVELTEAEAKKIYEDRKYICTSYGIFQPCYSQAQNQVYFMKILDYKGYARRGRYYVQTAEQINKVIGREILITI